jgi:RNA polymerase sigma-70 factor, ECF subfamily
MRRSEGLLKVSETDAALVQRALAGEEDAFAELMARHRPRLERYAYFLLGNRQDAEDVLQDSFVRAFRGLARCQDPPRVGVWMFQILVNRCRTRLARVDLIERDAAADSAYAEAPGEAAWERHEWREEIERALAELSSEQREAFLLKHVEDFSYQEISALTDAPVPALKMRVFRACERLRHRLEEATRDHVRPD